jgi:3-phosphoshikimate 1-carboxyvinyltransferase
MAEPRTLEPLNHPVDADVRVVGSKSYTNRALVIAALAEGESLLTDALFSDDTRYMGQALQQLGARVEADEATRTLRVHGFGGRVQAATAQCFVGNAGTAARFLPVVMALGAGRYEIDGVARMRERPIGPLVAALRGLGVNIEALGKPDCFPLRIHGGSLTGGEVTIDGSASSQYASGLMLAAPAMARGLSVTLAGELVSRPYLEMTAQVMRDFGARVEREGERRFVVSPGTYRGRTYAVEPDASAASYFFAAAAITGGRVRVLGLGSRSLQGDRKLVHILSRMGCSVVEGEDFTEVRGPASGLVGVEVDMADLSDVAQTLAVVAPFASSPTRVTGIGFIRRKETDRVGAVVRELNRLGIRAEEESDGFVVHPGRPSPGVVETYDDHRMAMSFALLGLVASGIAIQDPGCVSKTFPNYFDVLEQLRAPGSAS